jgi:hypothetical protein
VNVERFNWSIALRYDQFVLLIFASADVTLQVGALCSKFESNPNLFAFPPTDLKESQKVDALNLSEYFSATANNERVAEAKGQCLSSIADFVRVLRDGSIKRVEAVDELLLVLLANVQNARPRPNCF